MLALCIEPSCPGLSKHRFFGPLPVIPYFVKALRTEDLQESLEGGGRFWMLRALKKIKVHKDDRIEILWSVPCGSGGSNYLIGGGLTIFQVKTTASRIWLILLNILSPQST